MDIWGFQQYVGSKDKLHWTSGLELQQDGAQKLCHALNGLGHQEGRTGLGTRSERAAHWYPKFHKGQHCTGRKYTHNWAPSVEEAAVKLLMKDLRKVS